MFSFTPLRGFFSPFPHGTSTLSVSTEYLALEDGPPTHEQLREIDGFCLRDFHPLWCGFPAGFY
jgi:hypothetical protein